VRATPEEDRLAKRLAVVERDCARLREGPPPDAGLAGCGDHSCVVSSARGVGTNGGCRCSADALRRMLLWQAREIARLRGEVDDWASRCAALNERLDRGRLTV
jgi:hypothetical protein